MVFPVNFWLLFAAAMLISSIGFKKYVWFISLGYGFSIAGEGLLMAILYGKTLTPGTLLCCLLFIVYGLRLGGYLAFREIKSASYNKNMTGEIKTDVPFTELGLDSLDVGELVMQIENELNVTLDMSIKYNTVDKLVAYIEANQ